MLKRVLLAASLVVLLVMAMGSIGCSSSNGLISMLARVPSDTGWLKYVDVKTLRNDADLDALYGVWKTYVDSRLEAHGINPGDVDVYGSGLASGNSFTILVGKFDLDEIRDELDDRHYDDDEYSGVELWQRQVGWGFETDNEVALMGNVIVLGSEAGVEACIQVIKGKEGSWLSKADINDVANRLPGGVYVSLEKDPAVPGASGMEAYGLSFKKLDNESLGVAGVAKFGDEDEADDAEDAVDLWLDVLFDHANVDQAGIFLDASAELDIDDAGGFFGGL